MYPSGYDTKKGEHHDLPRRFYLTSRIIRADYLRRFCFLPELIRILVNAAMQIERQKYLGAGPYERSTERQGYANG